MKKYPVIISVLVCIMVISINSYAQTKVSVAVMNFEANNVSKYVSIAVSENISTELAKKKDLQVIERSKMGQILDEQGFQMSGCTNNECAVEFGKLLSARKIIVGTVSKLGNTYSIVSRVVDVEKGGIDFAESQRCAKEDDIDAASRVLAIKLLNKMTGKNYSLPAITFESEESRGKLSIVAGYKFGILPGQQFAYLKQTEIASPELANLKEELKTLTHQLSIEAKYDLTEYFTTGLEFNYFMTISDPPDEMSNSFNEAGYTGLLLYDSPNNFRMKGYSFSAIAQFNYPLGGFTPFGVIGLKYNRYQVYSYELNYYYSIGDGMGNGHQESFVITFPGTQDYFSVDLKLGFSVFVSRWVDLIFTCGLDYPLNENLFDNMKINKKSTSDTGTLPDEYKTLNITNNYNGKIATTYYISMGVGFRVL